VAIALLGSLLLLFTRLQAKAQALRTSEEHFRAITDTASEAIISTDQSWIIVSWNAAATLMFGYEAQKHWARHSCSCYPQAAGPP